MASISKLLLGLLGLILLVRIGLFYWIDQFDRPDGLTGNIKVTGVISNQPEVHGRTQRFTLDNLDIVTRPYPEYYLGEELTVEATGCKPGVGSCRLDFPRITPTGRVAGLGVQSWAGEIKRRLVRVWQANLPAPEAALTAGIVLGDKSGFDFRQRSRLATAGLSHVVAASGMNLTFLAGWILALGSTIIGRRKCLLLALPVIWFYTFISGQQPAIVRAAIMTSLSFLAAAVGRELEQLVSLALAGGLMLIISPILLSDLGFQLSFASLLGILVGAEPLRSLVGRLPWVGRQLTETLAAQLWTLPIILAAFGQYSAVSPLVNVLVLWTVAPIMAIGTAAGILGVFFPFLGQTLSVPIYYLARYFWLVADRFGTENGGLLRIDRPNLATSLGLYLLLAAGSYYLARKKRPAGNVANSQGNRR